MKRSWLIGAALVLSLAAVGCTDDDDEDSDTDSGVLPDGGPVGDAGRTDSGVDAGGMDASTNIDGGGDAATPIDSSVTDSSTTDASAPDASSTTDAATLDAG